MECLRTKHEDTEVSENGVTPKSSESVVNPVVFGIPNFKNPPFKHLSACKMLPFGKVS